MKGVEHMAAEIKQLEKEKIQYLVEIYNRELKVGWEGYQEGIQAGIRYALVATNQKVEGII